MSVRHVLRKLMSAGCRIELFLCLNLQTSCQELVGSPAHASAADYEIVVGAFNFSNQLEYDPPFQEGACPGFTAEN